MLPLLLLYVPRDSQPDRDTLHLLQERVRHELNARLQVESLAYGGGSRIKLVGTWDLTPRQVWDALADLVERVCASPTEA